MADCRHAGSCNHKAPPTPAVFRRLRRSQRLTTQSNFFDGWLNVLDKRRQQVLGMIAATDGLSATAPRAFYVFANCQALMGRMTWRRNPSQRQRAGGLAIRTNPGGRFTRLRVWNAGVFAYCVCDRRWPANPSLPADSGRLRAIALKACVWRSGYPRGGKPRSV